MVNYKYISLPIDLASDELMSNLHNPRSDETLLVTYIIDVNILGFSSIISEKVQSIFVNLKKNSIKK